MLKYSLALLGLLCFFLCGIACAKWGVDVVCAFFLFLFFCIGCLLMIVASLIKDYSQQISEEGGQQCMTGKKTSTN